MLGLAFFFLETKAFALAYVPMLMFRAYFLQLFHIQIKS